MHESTNLSIYLNRRARPKKINVRYISRMIEKIVNSTNIGLVLRKSFIS